MDAEFRQDLCKRTMTVHRNTGGRNGFREKMLMKNNIKGIARTGIQYLNGDSFYSYDMGSCQTLNNVFEGASMSYKELRSFLSGLSKVSHELEKYLLDVKDLMVDPGHIFWDLMKEEPVFCYYPENPGNGDEYMVLAQFLIDAVDKGDEEGSALAYAYFDRVCEDMILPDDILGNITTGEAESGETGEEKGKCGSREEIFTLPEIWGEDDNKDNYYLEEVRQDREREEKRGNPLMLLLSFVPAVAAAAAYGIIFMDPANMAFFGLNDGDYIRAGVGVTVFSGVFIAAGVYFWNKKRKEEEERRLDLDSLNSDIHEEYRFDELEERSMERTPQNEDDYEATMLLSDFTGKGKKTPVLCGRINGEERTYEIDKNPYMIGKMRKKADGVIEDPKVSRIHACIRENGGRYFLSDLNSTNGTCINERKLSHNETAELSDGDSVRFAGISMTFRLA